MLSLVPTPIGNISDISLRTLEVLSQADTLLCEDTRITKKLLHLLKERHNLLLKDKLQFISVHSHNENDFIKKLSSDEYVDFFDKNVVYMSDAGMPGISDPGAFLVQYAIANSIEYDILPGANAVLTAYVASGFSATKMLFFGFLPHKGKERKEELLQALYNGFNTVLYESPHRLMKTINEIEQEDVNRELFLAKELTKKFQTFYTGTATEIKQKLDKEIKGEWVIVIKASPARHSSLSEHDILELDIPKKQAAKLIAKITGENIKSCYNRLLSQ